MTAASAQTQTVKGRVVDENNAPVIGATVVVKNRPTIGTSTDVKGEFALQGVPKGGGGGKLQISYVGYKTQDVDIAPDIRVKLEPDAQAVEAVVVTGMTKMDKRLFTGAADQLVADDVKLAGMADISRGLEGRSAGVSVQNVSGTFGTAPKIRVRGATSIYGSSKPLWVVDGVIMEDIVDIDADDLSSGDATTLIASAIAGLNAEDIESFNILKDGSATSIYGARAMAGVIVITTKRGRAGVSTINYTGEFTYRMIPSYRDFNIMNSQDQMSVYMDMQKKGWLNLAETITDSESGVFGKMYQMIAAGQLQNDDASTGNYLRAAEFRNTNWFSELFNNNVMHTHSVSLTSGTDKSSYYASLSAMSDPGWTKTSKVERYTANINATYNIFKNLSLNLISNGSYRKQKAPGTLSSATNYVTGEVKREFDINPYSYALNTSRTLDPDEFYTRNYASFNILHELDNNYIDLSVVETKFQAELKWSPVEGLDLSALGAVKYQASIQEHNITESSNQSVAYRTVEPTTVRDNNPFLYTDPDNPYAVPVTVLPKGGIYERTDNKMLSYDFRASATYNKTFNNTHIINLYGGMSVNKIDRHNTWFRGWGLQYDMGMEPYYDYLAFKQGMENGSKYYTIGDTFYREVAFFFNGTYSYKGRYTINGTYRYEGTNKMGKSRKARWLPTWNISGAWNVHEEKFFSHVQPALSHLSLKASYSLTADRGPSYVTNSLAVIKASTPWRPTSGDTETGLKVSSLENAQLTYEKKHELNLGLDVGFRQQPHQPGLRLVQTQQLRPDRHGHDPGHRRRDLQIRQRRGDEIERRRGQPFDQERPDQEFQLDHQLHLLAHPQRSDQTRNLHARNDAGFGNRIHDGGVSRPFALLVPVRRAERSRTAGRGQHGRQTQLQLLQFPGQQREQPENESGLLRTGRPDRPGQFRQYVPVQGMASERLHDLLVRQRRAAQPGLQQHLLGPRRHAAGIQEPLDGLRRRSRHEHPGHRLEAPAPAELLDFVRVQRLQLLDGTHRQGRLHPHEGDFALVRLPEKTYFEAAFLLAFAQTAGHEPLPDLRRQETQRPGSRVLQHRRRRSPRAAAVHAHDPNRTVKSDLS